MVIDSGVPVNKSLIVSRAKSSGILVINETTSKETMHSLGLTVTFFTVSKNCTGLSIECGELAVRDLRKHYSHFARLWQGESIKETIIRRGQPSLCTFGRPYARAIDVSLGEICLASGLEMVSSRTRRYIVLLIDVTCLDVGSHWRGLCVVSYDSCCSAFCM